MRFTIGDQATVWASFRSSVFVVTSGDPAIQYEALSDPTTVTLTVVTPDGISTNYSYPADVQKRETGVYYMDYIFAQVGEHRFKWAASGAVNAVESEKVYVYAN